MTHYDPILPRVPPSQYRTPPPHKQQQQHTDGHSNRDIAAVNINTLVKTDLKQGRGNVIVKVMYFSDISLLSTAALTGSIDGNVSLSPSYILHIGVVHETYDGNQCDSGTTPAPAPAHA